jgi:hypothetical protein
MPKLDTARSRAADAAEALDRRSRRQRDRYSEQAYQERALYREIREAESADNGSLLRHLDAAQLAELERHLRDLNLQADLAEGRARDVKQASTTLIDAVITEQRTR